MDCEVISLSSTIYSLTLECTYNKGSVFEGYQFKYSHQVSDMMYYFRGAPDLMATSRDHSPIDLTVSSDSESSIVDICNDPMSSADEDEDNEVIENCNTSMLVSHVLHLPEKVGQVIAELHFIAAAKIIRCLVDHDLLLSNVSCRGILVDKSNGLIHCSLKVVISEKPTKIEVECRCATGNLTEAKLCYAVNAMIKNKT